MDRVGCFQRKLESQTANLLETAQQDEANAKRNVHEANTVVELLRMKTLGWDEKRVERELKQLLNDLDVCDRDIRGLVARLPLLGVPLQGQG
jgi:hypothetical protein